MRKVLNGIQKDLSLKNFIDSLSKNIKRILENFRKLFREAINISIGFLKLIFSIIIFVYCFLLFPSDLFNFLDKNPEMDIMENKISTQAG